LEVKGATEIDSWAKNLDKDFTDTNRNLLKLVKAANIVEERKFEAAAAHIISFDLSIQTLFNITANLFQLKLINEVMYSLPFFF
jgi:hypothetical protein